MANNRQFSTHRRLPTNRSITIQNLNLRKDLQNPKQTVISTGKLLVMTKNKVSHLIKDRGMNLLLAAKNLLKNQKLMKLSKSPNPVHQKIKNPHPQKENHATK